ncbi:MAG: hypothetical protein IPM16_10585 [Chloroflexi bacterium]|nr:hypothetical protein [Chloroflexota bacterium]
MKLTNAEHAIVAAPKILYLLSAEKSGGKDKFFERSGFSVAQWEVLQAAVLQHGQAYDTVNVVTTDFGVKYVVEGKLSTPDGLNPFVRSIWQIDHGETVPRFVTAYPVQEKTR